MDNDNTPSDAIPAGGQPNRKLLLRCPIAGIMFHSINDIWDELHEGVKLAIIRHRDNKYDENAVAEALAGDYDGDPDDFDFRFILGYIPRSDNEGLAAMLDMGWEDAIEAEICELNKHAPYSERIIISVYVNDDVPIRPRGTGLRVAALDSEEWHDFTHEIWERGFSCIRWGGYPIDSHNLPRKGNKVAIIHHDGIATTLYLAMTVARGDACRHFIGRDMLETTDDCIPFILTVVKGPVKVERGALAFLDIDTETDTQPDTPLDDDRGEKLMALFETE